MRKTKSRRFITLLELLIVFAILALVAGIGAFNLKALFSSQEELNEMDRVLFKLRKAQAVMVLLDGDIEIKFKRAPQGFSMEWVPAGILSKSVSNRMGEREEALPHLQEISFQDGVKDLLLKPPFSLQFLSRGFLMNRGVLTLKGAQTERHLLLVGYPWELQLVSKRPLYTFPVEIQDWILTLPDLARKGT